MLRTGVHVPYFPYMPGRKGKTEPRTGVEFSLVLSEWREYGRAGREKKSLPGDLGVAL